MKKSTLYFVIDSASALLMLALLGTGIIMHQILPPGSGRFKQLLGMNRHEWGDLHFWVACLLVTLIVTHVTLHWAWIRAMLRKFSGYKSI